MKELAGCQDRTTILEGMMIRRHWLEWHKSLKEQGFWNKSKDRLNLSGISFCPWKLLVQHITPKTKVTSGTWILMSMASSFSISFLLLSILSLSPTLSFSYNSDLKDLQGLGGFSCRTAQCQAEEVFKTLELHSMPQLKVLDGVGGMFTFCLSLFRLDIQWNGLSYWYTKPLLAEIWWDFGTHLWW